MPKKQRVLSRAKDSKFSLFVKLLVISTLIFIIGSVYRVYMYGEGPLAALFGEANSINLVNGLDPYESAYLTKTITANKSAVAPAPIKVTVKDPVSSKPITAKVTVTPITPADECEETPGYVWSGIACLKVTNSIPTPSLKPIIQGDGLEAEEAAFLQKSTSIDKPNTVGTAPAPVVKVTVINPDTGLQETSKVTLKPTSTSSSVQELTKAIVTKVKNVNARRVKWSLPIPSTFDMTTVVGREAFAMQTEKIAGIISECQAAGNILAQDLTKCFCSRVDCEKSAVGKSMAKQILDNAPKFLPEPGKVPTKSSLLECVEFIQIIYGSYASVPGSKFPHHPFISCGKGADAKDLRWQCLEKLRIKPGNWYYCNLKTNPNIPLGDGDLLIFPGDVGHISQVNCKGSANSIETCSMTDANAQNDGLVRTHPITDYRNRPDAVWKYLPSVEVINLGGCFASQETYKAANP